MHTERARETKREYGWRGVGQGWDWAQEHAAKVARCVCVHAWAQEHAAAAANAPGSLRAGRLRSPLTLILQAQIPAIPGRCRRRRRRRRWWRRPGRQMAEGMVGAPHCLLYARRGGGSRGRGEARWPVGGRRFSGARRRWRRGCGVLRRWRCPLAEGTMAAARAKSGPDLGPAGRGRCKLGLFVAVFAVATEVIGGRVRPAMRRRCSLVRLVSARRRGRWFCS
jgi:hypothetical protein